MPRTLSEKQKKAMAAGRQRKREAEQAGAHDRVIAYRAWTKRDAEITQARIAGNMIPREPMPPVPSSSDFAVVNGEESDDE